MANRIGLFGGTFDPVHNGHVAIAKAFLSSGNIDELWVLLTPYPPHKLLSDHAGYRLRLQMLTAALQKVEGVKILTIENELPKPSYTYRTIQYLKKLHPEKTFYFCMGEDSLERFHTWKKHKEILDEVDLLVAERPGASHEQTKEEILAHSIFVEHTPLDVSSSRLRRMISNKEDISRWVPPKVASIIQKHGLYKP